MEDTTEGGIETPRLNEEERSLARRVHDIGNRIGFDSRMEVQASESAWVDVVWFDNRLGLKAGGFDRPNLRRHPVLPIVGFEIEVKTGLNAKHVKGSISNLNNLGASMGVLVIGDNAIIRLRALGSNVDKSPEKIQKELLARAYRWVYAESQPRVRIVVMMEAEAHRWLDQLESGPKGVLTTRV